MQDLALKGMPEPYRYNGRHWMTPQPVLTPIPGSDLKVGDRLWINPTTLLVVEAIRLGHGGPAPDPQLVAHGPVQYADYDRPCPGGIHPFYAHYWVVVER